MTHEEDNFGGGQARAGLDEHKISELLGGLERVEAPKDFDFQLKARIANARADDYRPAGLFQVLKYAVPLALLLIVGAGILLTSSNNNSIAPIVGMEKGPEIPTAPFQPSTDEGSTLDVAASTPMQDPRVDRDEKDGGRHLMARDTQGASQGGSRDSHPRRTVDPVMTSSNSADKALTADRTITPVKRLSAKDALKLIGVDADFENRGWKVRSVKANEAAGQLGVRPGDIIKTIDGNPIGERTEFVDGIKLSRMQVERGGATVELGPPENPE